MYREVAQLGRALGLGPRGCRFKSCLPDHYVIYPYFYKGFIYFLIIIFRNVNIKKYKYKKIQTEIFDDYVTKIVTRESRFRI